MNSAYNDFSGQYKKNSIETASPMKLVLMLYEGAIRFIDEASENMRFETYDVVNNNISKAKDVVVELQTSLDFENGGEISDRLSALYIFVLEKLSEANLKKEIEPLKEARKILEDLLSSWQDVEGALSNNSLDKVNARDEHTGFLSDNLDGSSSFSIEG